MPSRKTPLEAAHRRHWKDFISVAAVCREKAAPQPWSAGTRIAVMGFAAQVPYVSRQSVLRAVKSAGAPVPPDRLAW